MCCFCFLFWIFATFSFFVLTFLLFCCWFVSPLFVCMLLPYIIFDSRFFHFYFFALITFSFYLLYYLRFNLWLAVLLFFVIVCIFSWLNIYFLSFFYIFLFFINFLFFLFYLFWFSFLIWFKSVSVFYVSSFVNAYHALLYFFEFNLKKSICITCVT